MTFGHVSAPASRRHLGILVPLAVGLVVGAALWFAGRQRTPHPSPPTVVEVEHVCTFTPPPEPPPKPAPPVNAWSQLERCLRDDPYAGSTFPCRSRRPRRAAAPS